MTLRKSIVPELAIGLAILNGCVSPEEKMYREAVASYVQHEQPNDREQDVAKLELSGSLGFGPAFVFLGDSEMSMAVKSGSGGNSNTKSLISEKEQMIQHLNKAYAYYVRAQHSQQAGNVNGKIATTEEALREAKAGLDDLERKLRIEMALGEGESAFREAREIESACPAELSGKIACFSNALNKVEIALERYSRAVGEGSEVAKERVKSAEESRNRLDKARVQCIREKVIVDAVATAKKCEISAADFNETFSSPNLGVHAKLSAVQNMEKFLTEAMSHYNVAKQNGEEKVAADITRLEGRLSSIHKEVRRMTKEIAIIDEVNAGDLEYEKIAAFNCSEQEGDCRMRLRKLEAAFEVASCAMKHFNEAMNIGATNVADRCRSAQLKKSEIDDALIKVRAEVERIEEAEEREKRKKADYCIREGVPLTAEAIAEIETSLNYKQSTGNAVADQVRANEERQRFRNRQVCVEGTIRNVKSGFFGGVNVWIVSHGHTIKCGFKGMSRAEGAGLEIGSVLRCRGTIDGSGSITNCSRY